MEDGSAWAQQGRVLKLRARRAHQDERKAEAAEILNRAKPILLTHLLTVDSICSGSSVCFDSQILLK